MRYSSMFNVSKVLSDVYLADSTWESAINKHIPKSLEEFSIKPSKAKENLFELRNTRINVSLYKKIFEFNPMFLFIN